MTGFFVLWNSGFSQRKLTPPFELLNGLFEWSLILSNAIFTQPALPARGVKWALIFSVRTMTSFCFVAVLKQRRESDAALFSELHRKLQTQVGHSNQCYYLWSPLLTEDNFLWLQSLWADHIMCLTECSEASLVRSLLAAEPCWRPPQAI